jgi:hypothetical protein
MAFGQQSGPPASARQVRELLALLHDAGHTDFRDARGPLGLTQRQAAGKFTREEAATFIEGLQSTLDPAPATAPDAAPPTTPGTAPATAPGAAPAPAAATTPGTEAAPGAAQRAMRRIPADVLAAELRRRGWTATEPAR